jgi:hypothetical protein
MADRSWTRSAQHHFVIRCWLETSAGAQAFWRGRVQEVGGTSAAFEDALGLVDFIQDQLRHPDGIELPLRRGRRDEA